MLWLVGFLQVMFVFDSVCTHSVFDRWWMWDALTPPPPPTTKPFKPFLVVGWYWMRSHLLVEIPNDTLLDRYLNTRLKNVVCYIQCLFSLFVCLSIQIFRTHCISAAVSSGSVCISQFSSSQFRSVQSHVIFSLQSNRARVCLDLDRDQLAQTVQPAAGFSPVQAGFFHIFVKMWLDIN